ncbi:putative peptidase [Modestobacter italicus]|uniref:Peptidase n=1 Tax=Modestobacter italicus (strain DSM 44449 / CECT 9708 / BC 501) TaxID=2732864 RepID=I4EYR5_MODI5|nr:NlpC/P60 family protein [Modestobacter marinus]CCH88528.1 putative peptidase [Modestobacter marinus]
MTGSDGGTTAIKALAGLVALVVSTMTTVLLVLAGGGAGAAPSATGGCGGGGTGQVIGAVALDAEQLGSARTIVSVGAGRRLPAHAAVIAVATAYTESKLRNSAVQTDHDSEGLFQQRVSIYTEAVAIDPIRSTGAFLDRLIAVPNWATIPVGDAAQIVQVSAYPDRYQPNAALAQEIVGRFWPTAVAEAELATSTTAPAGAAPAICPGAGGEIPVGAIVGPRGNNIAGTTTVPAGLVINGSVQGATAVRYALAQLGKPYVWAAAGPDAFDCSGLTMAAWAAAGVALPHLAAGQTRSGVPEPTNLSQAVAGDLVMIPGADGTAAAPGHVGMVAGYVDAPDGRHLYLVQAPMTGVPVEVTEATRWDGQVVAVRHIG